MLTKAAKLLVLDWAAAGRPHSQNGYGTIVVVITIIVIDPGIANVVVIIKIIIISSGNRMLAGQDS